MTIDLGRLCKNHPEVEDEEVLPPYIHRAAVALQRRHVPGVLLRVRREDEANHKLVWPVKPLRAADFLDFNRVTEDGAEAIALAVVQKLYGWTAKRRLQRTQFADWLLAQEGSVEEIAMEVTGTDEEDDAAALRKKVVQVRKCTVAPKRVACAVRFLEPRCTFKLVPEVGQ
jgi:hypothetical protein